MEDATETRLEEYRALRDEVKRCESESLQVTLYVFTASLVAASLTQNKSVPPMLIAVLLQVVLVWGLQRFYVLSMLRLRLSTYIQLAIEPHVEGLRWETSNAAFNREHYGEFYYSSRIVNWVIHRLGHLFSWLTLLGAWLSVRAVVDLIGAPWWKFLGVLFVVLLLLFMTGSLAWKAVFKRPKHDEYVAMWQSVLGGDLPRE